LLFLLPALAVSCHTALAEIQLSDISLTLSLVDSRVAQILSATILTPALLVLERLRVNPRDSRHADDVGFIKVADLQHMYGLVYPEQNGADGLRGAKPLQQFVCHVARFEVRTNQHVGATLPFSALNG